MYQKINLIIIIVLLTMSCNNSEHEPLLVAIKGIENSWSKNEIIEFKKLSETIPNFDFEYSYYYKDEILFSEKDSALVKYFYSKKINNTNDMTNIIFTTLHRKLNSKPLSIDEQLASVMDQNGNGSN